jgi:hypothetical protein
MGETPDPRANRPSSPAGTSGLDPVTGGTVPPALEVEELQEWLDDRMAATDNAGTLLILQRLREALSRLRATDDAIARLIEALRPVPTEAEDLGREDRWVVDARRASLAIAEARRLLEIEGPIS